MSENNKELEMQKIGDGNLENITGGNIVMNGWYTIYCTSGVVALRDPYNLNVQIAALNCGDRVQVFGVNGDFTYVYAERPQKNGYVRSIYLR